MNSPKKRVSKLTKIKNKKFKLTPKSNKKTLALTAKFKTETILNEIVIGKILGDGSINKTGSLNFCQSVKQRVYLEHCYQLFKPYLREHKQICSNLQIRAGKQNESLYFETCAIFKEFLPLFYKYETSSNKRIKIIPKNINEYLTFRGLAYWVMDDGTYNKGRVYLCTHSFTQEENILLCQVLETKFSLSCALIKRKNPKIKGEFWYNIKIRDPIHLWNLVKD